MGVGQGAGVTTLNSYSNNLSYLRPIPQIVKLINAEAIRMDWGNISLNFSLKFFDVTEDISKRIEQTVKIIIMIEIDAEVFMRELLFMIKINLGD